MRLFARVVRLGWVFLPHLFGKDMRHHLWKLFSSRPDFILSYTFHSIGAYRMGDRIVKYKLIPHHIEKNFARGDKQQVRIQKYLAEKSAIYSVQVVLCQDLKNQPVNDLTVHWQETNTQTIGQLEIVQEQNKTLDCATAEKLGYNPFQNPAVLQPVGKLQQTRKEIYATSIAERNPSTD